MSRRVLPLAMAAAFVALMGVSKVVKAVEVGDPVQVGVACGDKRTVEEHLALIQTDVTYGLVRERLAEDVMAGKCIRVPMPIILMVQEKGREVRIVDSDGDNMEITVVRGGEALWTLSGRIVGKEG